MTAPLMLVTGSTDGIGKAIATELLRGGAEVILHGRDDKKGRRVRKEMEDASGKSPGLVIADFSRPGEIREMAADLSARYSRLDVLINDAGTYQASRHVTPEGVELTFAVNYLGPFLLTWLLLPLMGEGSRIVTIASSAHFDVDRIDWENLPAQPKYDAWGAYSLSKFADVTFTYVLARNLRGTGITANCLHPGVVDTKILHASYPGYHGIPTEEAAQTPVWLARSPDIAGVTGKYFEEKRAIPSSPLSRDRRVQERLWKMAEELTGTGGMGKQALVTAT
ncbi:MAG TPA: SDR family NAD(P)-dependent oxidoreductase [Methanoregula sp.]|nr:SDR family NAD(P)-dependent oxidoreductase [Methanoregula sp.]